MTAKGIAKTLRNGFAVVSVTAVGSGVQQATERLDRFAQGCNETLSRCGCERCGFSALTNLTNKNKYYNNRSNNKIK
jgi:hypothetical protein